MLVLYAERESITLKYTRDDHVISGYTVHVEDVCVDPCLLSLCTMAGGAGHEQLPALRAGQAMGRAVGIGTEVAIRDSGAFMDPRARKDWWQSVARHAHPGSPDEIAIPSLSHSAMPTVQE